MAKSTNEERRNKMFGLKAKEQVIDTKAIEEITGIKKLSET